MKSFFNPNVKELSSATLFEEIWKEVEKKGLLPDPDSLEIDYHLADETHAEKIRSERFSIIAGLDYGASEGIYLDIAIYGDFSGDEERKCHIGTIKTLQTGDEAMLAMSQIYGAIILVKDEVIERLEEEYSLVRGFTIYVAKRGTDLSECDYSTYVSDASQVEARIAACKTKDSEAVLFVKNMATGDVTIR